MSDSRLRNQTQLWLAAISADLRRAIQREVDGLRSSVEQRIAVLENVVSASDEQLDQLALNVEGVAAEMVQEAAAQARQQTETAVQAELMNVRVQLQTDLEATRAEFETSRTALTAQLAETERDISAIRQKRDEHAASLEQAHARTAVLEEASAQAKLERELAEARLEEEVQRRIAIEKQLETSRQELLLARAAADSRRLEAQVAGERIRALEKTASSGSESHVVLAAVRNGLEELTRVRLDEVLSSLVEQLGSLDFAVAVFAVTSQGFKLWKVRTHDSGTALPAQLASLEGDSLLAQAFRQRAPARIDVPPSDEVLGLWQMPFGHAMALPLLAHGRVLAVVYGETATGHRDAQVLDTAAEILIGCVNRRLSDSTPAAEPGTLEADERGPSAAAEADVETMLSGAAGPQDFAVCRQAGRVKVDGTVEILVDGVTSTLVDVSATGAQVLSPTPLRPNRMVRLVLKTGALTCGGRVVWARLELPGANAVTQYRAGIQFTDVDPVAIEAFVSRHRQTTPAGVPA